MGFFSKLLKKEEPSSFLHYTDASNKKSDIKIYESIFTRDIDLKEYNDYTVSRLRARTGVSLEDAKILLGH